MPPVTGRDKTWPLLHFWCHHLWPKLVSSIPSLETQGLWVGAMRYFWASDIFWQKFSSRADKPLSTYSSQTSYRSVRILSRWLARKSKTQHYWKERHAVTLQMPFRVDWSLFGTYPAWKSPKCQKNAFLTKCCGSQWVNNSSKERKGNQDFDSVWTSDVN